MYCKHCGQIVEDNASFCPHCGKSVKVEPASYESAPTQPVQPVQTARPVEQKSKLAAGLLGILLGGLGIHNFYLGYTKKAVAQLLISVCGSCLIVGPLAAWIWGLVEGIMILCDKAPVDANGVPLKD